VMDTSIVRPSPLLPSLFSSPPFSSVSLLQVNEMTVIMATLHLHGTCKETTLGGDHFRYWAQTGGEANRSGSTTPSSLDDAYH
jgi:hypothetical protein